MKSRITTKTKWVVTTDGDLPDDYSHSYDTKNDALEEVDKKLLGKKFVIYKTTTQFLPVKSIFKKLPRPCYGGWGQGHSPKDTEAKKTHCTLCGYELKKVGLFDERFIIVKPLTQHSSVKVKQFE